MATLHTDGGFFSGMFHQEDNPLSDSTSVALVGRFNEQALLAADTSPSPTEGQVMDNAVPVTTSHVITNT